MLAMKRMSLLASGAGSTEANNLERDVARYKEESEKVRRYLLSVGLSHQSHRKSWTGISTSYINTLQTIILPPSIQDSKMRWTSCPSRRSRKCNSCSIYFVSCFGILEFRYSSERIYSIVRVWECNLRSVRKRPECKKICGYLRVSFE